MPHDQVVGDGIRTAHGTEDHHDAVSVGVQAVRHHERVLSVAHENAAGAVVIDLVVGDDGVVERLRVDAEAKAGPYVIVPDDGGGAVEEHRGRTRSNECVALETCRGIDQHDGHPVAVETVSHDDDGRRRARIGTVRRDRPDGRVRVRLKAVVHETNAVRARIDVDPDRVAVEQRLADCQIGDAVHDVNSSLRLSEAHVGQPRAAVPQQDGLFRRSVDFDA